jgi:hypothetical protein
MAEQRLYWGILEVIRVPVVCEYSGLGYSCGQHVIVTQPVNNPTPALLEFPSSRRFSAQAMDGDDAVGIRAYSYGQSQTYSTVVLSVVSSTGAILRSPKARASRAAFSDGLATN